MYIEGGATINLIPTEVLFGENERIIGVQIGINYNDVVSINFLVWNQTE